MPIGVADFRQIATAFMSQHLQIIGIFSYMLNSYLTCVLHIDLLDDPMEDTSSIFDLQAGHSSSTAAMRYGRTTYESQFMDRNMLRAFQMASRQWQQLLGLTLVRFPIDCWYPSNSLQKHAKESGSMEAKSPARQVVADTVDVEEGFVYTDRCRPVELISSHPQAKNIRTICLVPNPRANISNSPPDLKFFIQAQRGMYQSLDYPAPEWP